MNKYQKLHYSYDEGAAMREGRRRPSLGLTPEVSIPSPPAAMREGRRRPSLTSPPHKPPPPAPPQ